MKPLLTTVSFQNTLSLLDSFFYPFTPYLKSIFFLRIFKKSEEIKTTSRKGIQDMLLVKFFSVDWLPSHSLYDLVLRYGVKKCRLGKIKKLVKTWQFFCQFSGTWQKHKMEIQKRFQLDDHNLARHDSISSLHPSNYFIQSQDHNSFYSVLF